MSALERRHTTSASKDIDLTNFGNSTRHTTSFDEEDDDDIVTNPQQNSSSIVVRYVDCLNVATFASLFGILVCPLVAILYHFENTTKTHCGVYNFLPSFSAAIGNNFPETSIWSISICIMQGQRIFVEPVASHLFHSKTAPAYTSINSSNSGSQAVPWYAKHYHWLNRFHTLSIFIENIFLILLTYVSSSQYEVGHQIGFVGFLLGSILNMSLGLALCVAKSRMEPLPSNLQLSYNIKRISFFFFFFFASTAIYTYMRHEKYCEPYVYSFFALSEYLLILSNVVFHYTTTIDMKDMNLTFEM